MGEAAGYRKTAEKTRGLSGRESGNAKRLWQNLPKADF